MKILIIGAHGQLGWELCKRGKIKGFNTIPLDRPEFDVSDQFLVQKQVGQSDASLVINASAYTAVDQAESESEIAFAVNRDGPAYLASACADKGIPFIHLSTDYVFDGSKKSPYVETDPVSPLGVYGKSKAAGETKTRELLHEHIILRTAWLYGVSGKNFVTTMLRLGKEQERVRVVNDQYGCPTYAGDLAEATLNIAALIRETKNIKWGTYHYCGKGKTSWHGFAEKVFELTRQHITLRIKNLEAITTEDYPTPAKRPANSVLDCSLIKSQFGIDPKPWEKSLKETINQILSTKNKG